MVSIKISGVTVEHEFPIEFVLDGAEEFNLGVIKLNNLSKREAYPDFANVVITINGVDYESCIQQDISTRISPNIYNHSISLSEPIIKLSLYQMADRLYTTKNGIAITYKDQLDNILETHNFSRLSSFSYDAETELLLDVEATEKEYSGANMLTNLTDMFRSVDAVPTLSLDSIIGNEPFGKLGNLITLGDIIGEVVTSDIADYGLGVYSKIKNGTYEKEEEIGYTYFPSKTGSVSPRTEDTKFIDTNAVFILDSGIRKIQGTIVNIEVDTGSGSEFIEADISDYIVSKAEWDQLTVERNMATLWAGVYKNNTVYYNEGDNIIQNFGVKYENATQPSNGTLVQEVIIHSWLLANGYATLDWVPQQVAEMQMRFYYQPMRDMDVRVERHNIDRTYKTATVMNNQKDSVLELSRYGKALKSHINRIGNDTYEVTKTYNNLTPFTLWGLNDYTVDDYKVIKIHMIARHNSMDVKYLFVKNSSILNPLTTVNKSVSPFTIQKRNITTNFVREEYIIFSGENKNDTGYLTTRGRKALFNGLKWNATYDTPVLAAQWDSVSNGNTLLNMTSTHFPLGTSMVFHVGFKHPKFAGYQLAADTSGVAGYKLVPISFGDVNGEVETFEISYFNDLTSTPDTFPVGSVGTDTLIEAEEWIAGINPNEIPALSTVIHAVSDRSNLIVGDYFSSNNSLIKELGSEQNLTLSYYPSTTKHTIYDKYRKTGSTGTGAYSLNVLYQHMTLTGIPSGSSWILHKTEAPYNIYLAFNYIDSDLNLIYLNSLLSRPGVSDLSYDGVEFLAAVMDSVTATLDMVTVSKINQLLSVNLSALSTSNISYVNGGNIAISIAMSALATSLMVSSQRLDHGVIAELEAIATLSSTYEQIYNFGLIAEFEAISSLDVTYEQSALNYSLQAEFGATAALSTLFEYVKNNENLAATFLATATLDMTYLRESNDEVLSASFTAIATSNIEHEIGLFNQELSASFAVTAVSAILNEIGLEDHIISINMSAVATSQIGYEVTRSVGFDMSASVSSSIIYNQPTNETLSASFTASAISTLEYSASGAEVDWVAVAGGTPTIDQCLSIADVGNIKAVDTVTGCAFVNDGLGYASATNETTTAPACSDGATYTLCMFDTLLQQWACQDYIGELEITTQTFRCQEI